LARFDTQLFGTPYGSNKAKKYSNVEIEFTKLDHHGMTGNATVIRRGDRMVPDIPYEDGLRHI